LQADVKLCDALVTDMGLATSEELLKFVRAFPAEAAAEVPPHLVQILGRLFFADVSWDPA